MGIEDFYKRFEEILPKQDSLQRRICTPVNPSQFNFRRVSSSSRQHRHGFDRLYFDVNNLIYPVARKVKSESEFLTRLQNSIVNISTFAAPRKSVFLALDGPGPRAKLITQRTRRLKRFVSQEAKKQQPSVEELDDAQLPPVAAGEEETEEEESSTESEDVEASAVPSTQQEDEKAETKANQFQIDSLQFTPSTVMMDTITESLCKLAQNMLLHDGKAKAKPKEESIDAPTQKSFTISRFKNLEIYVSGSNREGEGEFKIFQDLAQRQVGSAAHALLKSEKSAVEEIVANSRDSSDSTNALEQASQDSQAQHAKHRRSGTKPRERVLIVGGDSDLVALSLLQSDAYDIEMLKWNVKSTLIDISAARQALLDQIPWSSKPSPVQEQNVIRDFVFLSLMSGNDYTPPIFGFNLTRVWKGYVKQKALGFGKRYLVHSISSTHAEVDIKFLQTLMDDTRTPLDLLPVHPRHLIVSRIKKRLGKAALEAMEADASLGVVRYTKIAEQSYRCDIVLPRMDGTKVILGTFSCIGQRLSKADAFLLASDNAIIQNRALLDEELGFEEVWKTKYDEYLYYRKQFLENYLSNKSLLMQVAIAEQDQATKAAIKQRVHEQLTGITWAINYSQGYVCNTQYYYMHKKQLSCGDIADADFGNSEILSLPLTWKDDPNSKALQEEDASLSDKAFNPYWERGPRYLYPLEFGLSLLPPGAAKEYLPEEAHTFFDDSNEGNPIKDLIHHNSISMDSWLEPIALERVKQAVALHMRSHKFLSPRARRNMEFDANWLFKAREGHLVTYREAREHGAKKMSIFSLSPLHYRRQTEHKTKIDSVPQRGYCSLPSLRPTCRPISFASFVSTASALIKAVR